MNIKFEYFFEKRGEIAPEHILENNIWVDVGNTEKDGVFDHHQDGGCSSSFESVMTRTEGYKKLCSYLKEGHGNPEVIFHVHEYPDIDCIFSVYAVQRMIMEGKNNPSEVFSENIKKMLLDYVNTIDSGLGTHMSKVTLYAYFCKIGSEISKNENVVQKRSEEIVKEGLHLVDLVVRALEAGEDVEAEENKIPVNLFEASLDTYINIDSLKYYSERINDLEKCYAGYQKDKAEKHVVFEFVNLWNTVTKKTEPVKAAIWKKLPSQEDEYIYARDEDKCLLTVYPYKIREENATEGVTRVIIALNRNIPKADEYSLLPLVEVIEQCEQIEEDILYEQTRRYRRDHSQAREDFGRFNEIPFQETNDPWYFSERGDQIDSPRIESILPYERILSIIKPDKDSTDSYMVKRASVLRYRNQRGNDCIEMESPEELGVISFGELYRKSRKMIEDLKADQEFQHLFVFVKIDPSMARYSNNWFKNCCMNMVGKSDAIYLNDNLLPLDYRTCLYTDQSITVLVATDKRNRSLGSLIDEEHLEQSRVCKDLKNLLEHQVKLRNIGASLSDTIRRITQETKEIDLFNAELVQLSARMEKDDLIADPLEQEVYAFIKEALGIDSLKNSVITSAQLLIKNAERMLERKAAEDRQEQEKREKIKEKEEAKRDEKIQAGIGLVAIFAIFSALVDAFDFITKFIPGKEDGWSGIREYAPVLWAEYIIIGIIVIFGIIATKNALQAWLKTIRKEKKNPDQE